MHRQLARGDALPRADALQQLADQLGALAIEHLPADDLAAELIFKQMQIKVLPTHLGGYIGDVPAEHLSGPCRNQGARLAALLRCALRAPMDQLALLSAASGTSWTPGLRRRRCRLGEARSGSMADQSTLRC